MRPTTTSVTPASQTSSTARAGLLHRGWARLFGETDAIERQLAAIAREGATLARLAHVCALLMLILFSAGSLVALAGDSIQAIVSGHATFPAIIAAGVSGLLVACMDTAMLYAASILRMLAARHAHKREGRLHRWVLFGVALLEASTYAYMSALYEHPSGVAWGLIGARALAAPLLSVYLSLARPLPVMARDMLALGERIGGEGVLRDLARIAGDASAPLAEKVRLYMAAAVIAPDDERRLRALLDVAQDRVAAPVAIAGMPIKPSDGSTRPPAGPGKPSQKPGVRTPSPESALDAPNIVQMPVPPAHSRRRRKGASSRSRAKGRTNVSVQDRARAAWQPGMSVAALRDAAGISHGSAQKYHAMLNAEAATAHSPAQQAIH